MSTLATKQKQASDIAMLKLAILEVKAGGSIQILSVRKNNRAARRKAKK